MDKELKNKFDNFNVEPPDYILNNLKNDLGFAKQNFIVKHKYTIAASIVGAVIALFIFINNNETVNDLATNDTTINNKEIKTIITKENNVKTPETKEINTENDNVKIKEPTTKKTNGISNNVVVDNSKSITKSENKIQKINIFAGNDVFVCGTQCQLGEKSNTKNGKWLSINNVKFNDIRNPKSLVNSNTYGKQMFVWEEETENGTFYDTVFVNFIEPPSNITIKQINEHCSRADAIVEFVTNKGNYKFKWSDGIVTSNPVRTNLHSDNYEVIVIDEKGCSKDYNIDIINTEIVDVDFYHTELYSAVNTPIYFTDRTKVTTVDKNELKYEWSFGDGTSSNKINPEHTYTKAGEYTILLTVSTKNNCSDSYETKITIEEDLNVIPNIFTPNGDGSNDILIINPKPLSNFKGIIFNKAGQQVFEWYNQYEGWDGNFKNGEPASEGVYYFVVTGTDSDGKKFQYRSFVHLSR